MPSSGKYLTTFVGAAALFSIGADAHGYLGLPAVTFPNDVDKTQFVATIESSASGFLGSYSGSPAENTKAFWAAFKSSKYSSIKEFVKDMGQIVATGATIECGLTDPKETPQPIPAELEWTHSDTEGFTSSHEGPCEAWCDDTQVFQDTNCAAHFTTAPAKMPIDQKECSGASRLKFYWLALHSSTWQVYANCAALEGGSGSYSPSPSNSTNYTEKYDTPTVTTATPESTTATPTTPTTTAPTNDSSVAGEADEEDCGSLDIADTEEECGSFDLAGSDDQVDGEADTEEKDCGSLDVAASKEEEDCGSLDIPGNDESIIVSESSISFDAIKSSYISGKVHQPHEQN